MKTLKWFIPAILLGLIISLQMEGQEHNVLSDTEKMPEFPGGMDALREFMAENIQYPADAKQEGIQGRVFISFTVDTEGKIIDAEIVKGVQPSIDAMALRVVRQMPAWNPGEKDGKPVSVRLTVPVQFSLDLEPHRN